MRRLPRSLIVALVVVLVVEGAVRLLAPHLPEPLIWDVYER